MNTHSLTDQYIDSKKLSSRVNLHAQYSTNPQGWGNWLFQQMDFDDGSAILDVGCGPGGLWRSHLDYIPANCRIMLTDSSEGMVNEAQDALYDDRFEFKVADVQRLPYPDKHFDRVIANHMLYHVPDLNAALSEISRVLKADGKLYAATNGTAHMRELHEIISNSIPSFQVLTGSFTLENGEGLLRRHFDHVTLHRYEDSLVVPNPSALSAYVRSMASVACATEQQLSEIDTAIFDGIRQRGPMQIGKDAGIFIATFPRKAEQSP